MIITIRPSTPYPLWSAKIDLDYAEKTWHLVGKPTKEWLRISNSNWGMIRLIWRGKDHTEAQKGANLWLLDNQGGNYQNTPIILHDAPISDQDTIHKGSSGLLFAPVDKGLKDAKISWSFGAGLSPVVGSIDKSIRQDAMYLIKTNIGDKPGTKTTGANWVEKKARDAGTEVNAQGFRATGCGGLPGKLFEELEKLGWPIPKDQFDAYDPRYMGRPKTSEELKKNDKMQLVGFGFGYKFMVQEIERSRKRVGQIYIDFSKKGKRHPLPGDIYVIAVAKTGIIRHVGVVMECDGSRMITADGGQGASGFDLWINEKSYDAKSYITGGKEQGILDGWVDLEALVQ